MPDNLNFIQKTFFIIKKDRNRFLLFLPFFLILSMLDLIGLSLIAPIILLLTENPDRLIDTINSLIFSKFGYILSFYEALLFFTLSIILVFSIKAFFSIVITTSYFLSLDNPKTK